MFADWLLMARKKGTYLYDAERGDLEGMVKEFPLPKGWSIHSGTSSTSLIANEMYYLRLETLPGNCGVMMVSNIPVTPYPEIMDWLVKAATKAYYSRILIGINKNQQQHIGDYLQEWGFKIIDSFTSRRTDKDCFLMVKEITDASFDNPKS